MVRVGLEHYYTVEEIKKVWGSAGEEGLKKTLVLAHFASAVLERFEGSSISRQSSFWIIIDTFAGNLAL